LRFHSHYPLFQIWRGDCRRIVRGDTLSIARFEPTVEETVGGGALLDLLFFDGERSAIVPYIRLQSAFLQQRERTPMVWPSAARDLGRDVLLELERLVLPWLQSLTLARQQNEENVRTFKDGKVRDLFDSARDAGFLGAARYRHIMPAFAPYVYAARFCANRTVFVDDPLGANGAAMLAERAKNLRADLGSAERNALANAWFGKDVFGEAAASPCDVVIAPAGNSLDARVARITLDSKEEGAYHVGAAAAVPADVMISFDPDDTMVASTFSVRANVPFELRAPMRTDASIAAGGSSGTILMLLRDDFERAPDADVDEARSLASRLRAEGFTVELASPSAVGDERHADLVHAFGLANGMDGALEKMRRKNVPIVASPCIGATVEDAVWGPEIVSAAWGYAGDDGMLREYLDLIALRKLNTETTAKAPELGGALRHVDVALAAAAGEETRLRGSYGFTGEIVRYAPVAARPGCAAADIVPITGTSPFVLVHAPVRWGTNLPLLAYAAVEQGLQLVVAGPSVDVAAMRYAARQAPELVMHVAAPSEEQQESLYRGARVYADLSWSPRGYSRIARAAAGGCRLLLSSNLHAAELWPGAAVADPASPASVSAALSKAWNQAQPAPAQAGGDLFSAVIFAYSKAAAARQPA